MAQQLHLKSITAPQTEAERVLKLQKDACRAQPYPSLAVRLDLLTRLVINNPQ